MDAHESQVVADELLALSREWNAYINGMPNRVSQAEAYRHLSFQQSLIFKAIMVSAGLKPVKK